jgi:hypothetical protein
MTPDNALKDLIKTAGDAGLLLSDLTKGFKLAEIGEGLTVGQDLQALLSEAPNLLIQYKGLDDAARADLVAEVAKDITFPANVTVQQWIERVLDFAISLSSLISLGAAKTK